MDNYLQHYGVLGMHWGIRRYQNTDGSLTSAGKKRYSKQAKELGSLKEKQTKINARMSANIMSGMRPHKYYTDFSADVKRQIAKDQIKSQKLQSKINEKQGELVANLAKDIDSKIQKDKQASKDLETLRDYHKKTSDDYGREYDKYLSGKGKYKDLDYYEFKDRARYSVIEKNWNKNVSNSQKNISNFVKKELSSDKELSSLSEKDFRFGKQIVDSIIYSDKERFPVK